jgi:hypothetical protein
MGGFALSICQRSMRPTGTSRARCGCSKSLPRRWRGHSSIPPGLARVLINGPLANERRRSAQGQNRSIFRRGVDDALGSSGPSWLGYAIDRCGNLSAVSSPIFMPEVEGRAGLSPLRAGFRARQGSNACRTPSEQRVLRPLCKTQVP